MTLNSSPAGVGPLQLTELFVFEKFSRIAVQYAGRTAITNADGSTVTYAALASRAAAIAVGLREAGVTPGDRVAVMYARNSRFVEAILGVLAAGAAYVPLDVSHPAERIAYILEGCGAKLLLTEAGAVQPDADVRRVETNDLTEGGELTAPPHDPARPIYVIYTSGSTGRPKGVEICEGNLLALFNATAQIFNFSSHHVWTLFHSTAFDFSVWEIYGAILYGGRIVCVDPCTALDPSRFANLIVAEGVTFLNQTPSAFYRLLETVAERPPRAWEKNRLEWVVFGGEALSFPRLRPWLELPGASAKLVNMYGITETCVHTSWHVLTDADIRSETQSNIGKALPGLQFHLLDANGQRVAKGKPGENWVIGPQVSRGYLGRPDLTTERFTPPPALASHLCAYRSGDILSERADGSYVYLGRCDNQVNIRGFRVELEEVEAALTGMPEVLDACAGAEGEDDMMSLIGFIAAPPDNVRTPGEWRDLIRQTGRLPDYMIPNRIVCVDFIPLTVNGKKDRKKLLELYGARTGPARVTVDSSGDLTAGIRQLWAALLGHENFTNEDNFFDVGGTSLRAVQLFALMTHNGLADPDRHTVITLFENATVMKLASKLAQERDGRASASPTAISVNRLEGRNAALARARGMQRRGVSR